jgi:hypothetical protein
LNFKLKSSYEPRGDQPAAIDHLVRGLDAEAAPQENDAGIAHSRFQRRTGGNDDWLVLVLPPAQLG